MDVGPRALCTLEGLKEYLSDDGVDQDYDPLLVRLIDDASAAIHRAARREFKPMRTNPDTRLFDVDDAIAAERRIRVGDLARTAGLSIEIQTELGATVAAIDASTVAALPRVREPWQPITELWLRGGEPLRAGHVVEITGDFGFPEVPGEIRHFAIVQAAEWFSRDVAKFSLTYSLEEGRVSRPRPLSPAIRDAVLDYRHKTVGA
jgi:hypothetical protein